MAGLNSQLKNGPLVTLNHCCWWARNNDFMIGLLTANKQVHNESLTILHQLGCIEVPLNRICCQCSSECYAEHPIIKTADEGEYEVGVGAAGCRFLMIDGFIYPHLLRNVQNIKISWLLTDWPQLIKLCILLGASLHTYGSESMCDLHGHKWYWRRLYIRRIRHRISIRLGSITSQQWNTLRVQTFRHEHTRQKLRHEQRKKGREFENTTIFTKSALHSTISKDAMRGAVHPDIIITIVLALNEIACEKRMGLLADDMGLGKTMSVLLLIHAQAKSEAERAKPEDSKTAYKPNLVLCPSNAFGTRKAKVKKYFPYSKLGFFMGSCTRGLLNGRRKTIANRVGC